MKHITKNIPKIEHILSILILVGLCAFIALYLYNMFKKHVIKRKIQSKSESGSALGSLNRNNSGLSGLTGLSTIQTSVGNSVNYYEKSNTTNAKDGINNIERKYLKNEQRTKLMGYFKEPSYGVLDQKDVIPKEKYICNNKCICDKKNVDESLENIRRMFQKDPHEN